MAIFIDDIGKTVNYNLKKIEYPCSTQYVFFEKPQKSNYSRKKHDVNLDFYLKNSQLDFSEIVKEVDEDRSQYVSQNRSKNSVYSLARSYDDWKYFLTFTFDKRKVDRYDYQKCADKLKNWLDTYRRKNKDFRYIIVAEQHKDGAYHFHGIISNCDDLKLTYNKNLSSSSRYPIYNIDSYGYGFTTVSEIRSQSRVVSYIGKYLTKNLSVPKGKKRYWSSRNLIPVEPVFESVSLEEFHSILANSDYSKTVDTVVGSVYYLEKNKTKEVLLNDD